MGWHCPTCNRDEPQVKVLNADLQPATKADDGVIIQLACGHTLGTAELSAYREAVLKINQDHGAAVAELNRKRMREVGEAWAQLKAKHGGVS